MGLQIERIDTRVALIPYKEAVKHPYLGARSHNYTLIVEVRCNDGSVGVSYIGIQRERQIAAIRELVIDFEPIIKGQDPLCRELIYDRLWGMTVDLLHDGATNIAIALIDIALWDIAGKQAKMPLWKLLGGFRDKVRVYASDTLWRHHDAEKLRVEGLNILERGFDAMKLRFGGGTVEEDIKRAAALRKAVGPDAIIHTDLLWGYQPEEAIKLADGVKDLNLYWLEEPCREGNFAGIKRVRENTHIPIAAGERISRLGMIDQLIPCIDHAILDVLHIGGLTPAMKAAAMLSVYDLPISTHSTHEISNHFIAALRNGAWLEHIPRREVLFVDFPQPKNGVIEMTLKPGLGLEIDEKAMKQFAANK
jgi:L-alanine-DL-glutamate epimerase-like enolase superfamily enzyme